MNGLIVDPLSEFFPMMIGAEFDSLVESVRASGLCVPITLRGGKILDDRNRCRACQALGVAPRFEQLHDGTDPLWFVIDANITRRERYPADWHSICWALKEAAGWACEWCAAEHRRPHPITGSGVVLTTAHLDHQPENNSNLHVLCQRCHNRYDAATRRAGTRSRVAGRAS